MSEAMVMADDFESKRRRARITAFVLALVALGFFVAFFISMSLRS